MKERKITKTALLIGISVLLILAVLAVTLIVGREDSKKKETPLGTYWTEDSAAAQSLREYVAKVTDPADKATNRNKAGISAPYLSQVLNGRKDFKSPEIKQQTISMIQTALEELIARKEAGQAGEAE